LRARLADGLVQQILEHRALALETVGGDVGKVVGNHVQRSLLGIQPGTGGPQ
jgi:hypothetical protein